MAIDPVQQKQLEGSWMAMKSRDIPVEVAYGWGRRFRSAPVAMGLAAPPVGMLFGAAPTVMSKSAGPMRKSSRSLSAGKWFSLLMFYYNFCVFVIDDFQFYLT